MNIDEKKLAKFRQSLSEALQQSTDGLTKEEFTQAFQTVLDFVKGIKKENTDEWQLVHAALQMLEAKLKETNSNDFAALKKELSSTTTTALTTVKANVEERLNTALATFSKEITDLIDEQETSLNYVRDKADSIQPGKNGKDANEQVITETITTSLLSRLEEELTKIRGEFQQVGSNKAGWGAHPLTIAGSGTVKSKTTRHINFKGTGVSSVVRNPDGTVDVTISGGSGGGGTLTSETPVGTVDGVNAVFTVSNTPVQVYSNGALQTAGGIDYTLSGLTITFVSAPVSGSLLSSWYFSSVAQGTPAGEVPSGSINSSNVTFTLAHTPSPASALQLQIGRQPQIQGTDYTLSGATITYITAPDISLVGTHYAYYLY